MCSYKVRCDWCDGKMLNGDKIKVKIGNSAYTFCSKPCEWNYREKVLGEKLDRAYAKRTEK